MPITVACSCGKKFQTKDENAGKKSRCTACGAMIVIGAASKPVAAGAAAKSPQMAASVAPARPAQLQRAAPAREDLFDLVEPDEPVPPRKQTASASDSSSPASASAASPAATMFPPSSHRPITKDRDRTIHIGGGLFTFTIAALIIVGILMFAIRQGPIKAGKEWRTLSPKSQGDVITVVSFAMRGYYASMGANSGTFRTVPQATSAWFDEPLLMWRIPSSLPVQGIVTGGKFHGIYHLDTGELEADIVLENEGTTINITGRLKDDKTSAEMAGVPLKDLPAAGWSGSRYK